jgi:hypothetical protein
VRRTFAILLLGVGAFAIALAVLLRFYAYPSLALLPLDQSKEQGKTVAVGQNVTFYDTAALTLRTGTLTVTQIAAGNITAPEAVPGGHIAVWKEGLAVTDSSGKLIQANQNQVCMDRYTGMAVEPCSQGFVDDRTDVKHAGLSYKFPFNTARVDYPYYDTFIGGTTPMRYLGDDTINGVPAYKFVQDVPATKIGQQDVPGPLANGAEGTSVSAGRYYSNTRTVWVEPVSGIIMKGQEQQRQWFRSPDNRDGADVLKGTFIWDDTTVKMMSDRAAQVRPQLSLLYSTGPIGAGVVGIVALLIGIVLLATGRRRGTEQGTREGSPDQTLVHTS